MSPRAKVLLLGVAAYLAAAFLLSSCTTTIPLGDAGRYGYLRARFDYMPPIDMWQPAPFLPDK